MIRKQAVILTGLTVLAGYVSEIARGNVRSIRLGIPSRNSHDLTGSQFVKKILCESFSRREELIVREIIRGNFPDNHKILRPVLASQRTKNSPSIYLWVMPDYLGVGSEADFVRTPLNFYSSVRVAGAFKMELPTPKIVDLIFQQSECKLTPKPMKPGREMQKTGYFFRHQRLIESELSLRQTGKGLLSGHKKDVVISNKLSAKPGRIAIYGWHRPNGRAIQPCSTVHNAGYSDYSHGLRLVYPRILVNGKWHSLRKALRDKSLSRYLSNEGPVDVQRLSP